MSTKKKLGVVKKVFETFSRKEDQMNILIFDIETSPNLGYTWQRYEQNVIEVVGDWHLLSFSAKWLGKPAYVKGLCDYSGYKKDLRNDRKIAREIWKLFDQADVIVAHNGNAFDIKKCQARFLIHGMKPPSPFKAVDTKLVAKRYFKFDSNKLDELGRQLGLGRKLHHDGFELWTGCMAGNMESWAKMLKYNKQDVILLEQIYLKLLPYMTAHPNYNVVDGTTHNCPNCGSTNTQRRGTATTRVSSYQRFQCQNCGSWSRGCNVEHEKEVMLR